VPAYPYVPSPDKISAFFKKIGEMGIPSKFTTKNLRSLGFTSSNDTRLLNLIKFLGLTDQSGAPTPLWTEFRKHQKAAIAKATRAAYADLFQHFPDAHQRDAEALRTYFATTSSLGVLAVGQMVTTFKAICRLADFSSEPTIVETPHLEMPRSERQIAKTIAAGDGLTVNINIQLQLPADATAETYERFFEAMRKHILAPVV
jgi:hypothetical protein